MHETIDLKVQYFGTPVVLISTRNPDGTANLAPMSSAWWLNGHCVLGMNTGAQTTRNMLRERQCVLNLPSSDLADTVDRLALLTGSPELTPHKIEKNYRYEPDKFGTAGLTPVAADLVDAPLVAECPVQLECELVTSLQVDPGDRTTALNVRVLRAHVDSELIVPGTRHIDPVKWDPLIMKFCEFFAGGAPVRSSRLARAWQIPETVQV